MTNSKHPILVFGATGRQGGSVAKALLKAGWPIRALVLDSTKAASLQLRNAGVELVQGSFEETNVVRSAMKDAFGVFLAYCQPTWLPKTKSVMVYRLRISLLKPASTILFIRQAPA